MAQLRKAPEYLRANVSKQINVSRTGLYKSFAPNANPSFATVCGILTIAGVGLSTYAFKINKSNGTEYTDRSLLVVL